MAEQVAKIVERPAAPRSRIERAIVMHGTSAYRETAARIMAELLDATGASGVAFGWTDVLAPGLLAPVHLVTRGPGLSWEIDAPLSHGDGIVHFQQVDPAEPLDSSPSGDSAAQVDHTEPVCQPEPVDSSDTADSAASLEWKLVVKDASRERLERVAPLLEYAKGYFAHARGRDVPSVATANTSFVELVGALRFCGFHVAGTAAPAIRTAFRDEIAGLPESARGAAEEVVRALRDGRRLQAALLRLGSELDVAGAFSDAAAVHLVGYELALQRGEAIPGIDAARSAGRAFRRMGDLGSSIRWYELAARIAEAEGDRGRLALALDGAGNTHRHRGSFPRARQAYEAAWGHAVASGDRTAIGNVATSMMTVEREAGDLAAAATYGWTSLVHRKDPEARARALINLGTLLREGRDLENAGLAFQVARRATRDLGYQTLAADGLAYCAALRGDRQEYTRLRGEVRRAGVREPFLRAQIGYFRALSLAALGEPMKARRVLRAVERYARSWKLAEWEIKAAETELPLPHISPMDTPVEVRQGLRRLEVAPA